MASSARTSPSTWWRGRRRARVRLLQLASIPGAGSTSADARRQGRDRSLRRRHPRSAWRARRDARVRRRAAPRGADRDPVLLPLARHLRRHQHQGHAQRRAGGAGARRASGSSTPRPARCTARRASCRSPRTHPLQGQSPYSASKIGADQIALSVPPVVRARRSTIVRPFNTYGPRQSARAVIPTIITQIAAGAQRDQARRAAPDARFQLRARHGARLRRGRASATLRSARSSTSAAVSRSRSATPRD